MILTLKRRYDEINEMSVADGLKALLIEYGFTTERLIMISPSDLACILEIEEYVSKIGKRATLTKYTDRVNYIGRIRGLGEV